MRAVVCVEGKQPGGYIIQKGALHVDGESDGVIPVVLGGDENSAVIGTATGFSRDEETGEIWMDIKFSDPASDELDLLRYDISLYATNLHFQDPSETPKVTVVNGRVRSVNLILDPGYPIPNINRG